MITIIILTSGELWGLKVKNFAGVWRGKEAVDLTTELHGVMS
jgi:hypothetical protein